MKKIVLIVLVSLASVGLMAQKGGVAPLAKGGKQLNFGTGFSGNGIPVYVSMDFAIHKDITITPVVNIKIDDDFKVGALVKGDYHFNYLLGIPSTWDVYAGAHVGFDFGKDFLPNVGVHIGGRWYWSEKWGLNLELGGGTGVGTTIGLSMKL